MHMSDALLSPAVAATAGVAAAALLAAAVRKVARQRSEHITALMGVMGAFIFAAQMINFAIPGTGSSGHIVGGILLASVLGPWAAFITLTSVLVIQALIFADGGLMALGCNILNMAAALCLVAYPLIYRPLVKSDSKGGRIMWVSVAACTVGLELGAAAVTLETGLSGIAALPTVKFLSFMLPIHLLIGIVEGLATGAVIWFVSRRKPELLESSRRSGRERVPTRIGRALAVVALAALLTGGLSFAASSQPDGLEWSIVRTAGAEELEQPDSKSHNTAAALQEAVAPMPDYDNKLSGIIGSGAILLLVAIATPIVRRRTTLKQ